MAAPGWYPDTTAPGQLRWWDGNAWTSHTMSAEAASAAPPRPTATDAYAPQASQPVLPPAAQPKLRSDGTLRGPTFRTSMLVTCAGLALMVVAAFVLVPAVMDSLSGPRFAVPGSSTLSLDEGRWVLYERTGGSSGTGGFGVEFNPGVTVWPANVSVDGPAPVDVDSARSGVTQTITTGGAEYVGVVRLDVAASGEYQITIDAAADTEVLVARPVTDLFAKWPWLVAFGLGGVALIVGLVMWGVGAANRRVAKRAGLPVG